MKTIKKIFAASIGLAAAINSFLTLPASAQSFTVLYNFTTLQGTNSDGGASFLGLITTDNILYGTANSGGASGNGTLFRLDTATRTFTNLHSFLSSPTSEGNSPQSGLVLSDANLFGIAYLGGAFGNGALFRVNLDGTGMTNLHDFTSLTGSYPGPYVNMDGTNPKAGLVLSSNVLYGTTTGGGASGNGIVFRINTDGTGFTNLHSFSVLTSSANSDGAGPSASLILSGRTLYGTAHGGGVSGVGTVFKLNIDSASFTNLHNFTNGVDGANPAAGLTLVDDTLYGTTFSGGSTGFGTIYKLNTNGDQYSIVHTFAAGDFAAAGIYTNSDGTFPYAGVTFAGGLLYGVTQNGGRLSYGTLYCVDTNGSNFTNLHSFNNGGDGASPQANLILSGNTLYGTTERGGSSFNGTIFSYSLPSPPPALNVMQIGNQLVLKWSDLSYVLQTTTNLASPTGWQIAAPLPVVIAGNNTVSNTMAGPQQFYRLLQSP